MKPITEKILTIMRFLAWIAFVGLLIKAGAILMSFGVSVTNSEAAKDMYRGMDLSHYENYSFVQYSIISFSYIILYLLQAYVALFVAKLLGVIQEEEPTPAAILGLLQKVSYTILGVFILAIGHNLHLAILEQYAKILPDYLASEFIFLAGVVYVLTQILKRNVQMQLEK